MKRTGPKERKKKIISILRERKKVPVAELEEILKVPASTIRRDLRELVEEGLVTRFHGAVELKKLSVTLLPEPDDDVDGRLVDCFVAGMTEALGDAQFIFAGAGTMTEEIAKAFKGREIVTNSLGVAIPAAQHNTVKLIGETLDRSTYTLYARDWLPFLKDRIFETVVIEAEGYDEQCFYASEEQFWLLTEILKLSRKTVLLCRSARYGKANSRRLEYKANVRHVLTDMAELADLAKGKPGWEGIKIDDVYSFGPVESSPSAATQDAAGHGDHGDRAWSADSSSQAGASPDSRKVVGNVVFPPKKRWSEGKQE